MNNMNEQQYSEDNVQDVVIGDCKLMFGDCLERMKEIPDGSVDMILCDLPYGTTDAKWDSVIPFDSLWMEYERVVRKGGAIVLFAAQPFTSALVMSNVKQYKTSWVWNKSQSGGFATAKYHPLKITEDILVFCQGTANYNPQMRKGKARFKGGSKKQNELQSGLKQIEPKWSDDYYPTNVLDFVSTRTGKVHPTQKPTELCEYLIKTYSMQGQTILDNTMGSGTTLVAALNTGRKAIGIEMDKGYFDIAAKRIYEAQPNKETQ
jgi:site-specific DNA-methyltransferase (adenine-specific)